MNADRRDVNAFVFTGRIRPEWTSVRIDVRDPPLRFQLGEIEGNRGEMTVLINASQFSLLVTTEKPVENLATFRNGIITVARSLFDAIGYHAGQAIDIEITSLTDLRGQELHVFLDGLPEYSAAERPLSIEELVPLAVSFVPLRQALSDLRQTLTSPADTAVFSYRAIESIMQHFRKTEDKNRQLAWDRLRDSLRIERTWIEPVQKFAEIHRHGTLTMLTGAERLDITRRAWLVVDRFCVYLRNEQRPLTTDHAILA
jgi:hypothetical protein